MKEGWLKVKCTCDSFCLTRCFVYHLTTNFKTIQNQRRASDPILGLENECICRFEISSTFESKCKLNYPNWMRSPNPTVGLKIKPPADLKSPQNLSLDAS